MQIDIKQAFAPAFPTTTGNDPALSRMLHQHLEQQADLALRQKELDDARAVR